MKKFLSAVLIVFVSLAMPAVGITVGILQDMLTESALMCGILFSLIFISAVAVVIAINIKELIKK